MEIKIGKKIFLKRDFSGLVDPICIITPILVQPEELSGVSIIENIIKV